MCIRDSGQPLRVHPYTVVADAQVQNAVLRAPGQADLAVLAALQAVEQGVFHQRLQQQLGQTAVSYTHLDVYKRQANALSDVVAMGAKPLVALNLLALDEELGTAVAAAILQGGADAVREAGALEMCIRDSGQLERAGVVHHESRGRLLQAAGRCRHRAGEQEVPWNDAVGQALSLIHICGMGGGMAMAGGDMAATADVAAG